MCYCLHTCLVIGYLYAVPGRVEGGDQPALSFEQFFSFSSFPFLLAFEVGGLGFEFCVFVAGWRHALRSEWPFIININMLLGYWMATAMLLAWPGHSTASYAELTQVRWGPIQMLGLVTPPCLT